MGKEVKKVIAAWNSRTMADDLHWAEHTISYQTAFIELLNHDIEALESLIKRRVKGCRGEGEMITYKDQSFCSAECLNKKCGRYFSEYQQKKSKELDLPVSMMDFSQQCDEWRPRHNDLEQEVKKVIAAWNSRTYEEVTLG